MRRLDTGCTALAVLITLAAAAVGSVQAQEAATDEGFGEELTVTEVLLDVVVTDKKDNLILGLGRDDFVVTERGEPVELGSVTFYSSKRLLESSEVLTRPDVEIDVVPQDRFFVIFVQEQTSRTVGRPTSYSRQIRAGRDLARWLVEVLQPADRVAVVSYHRRLKLHQDFTTDRQALVQAVEGAVRGRDPERVPPSRRVDAVLDPAVFSELPSGKELRRSSASIYSALRLVARVLGDVPGRKNLVFLGNGFGGVGSYGRYEAELGKLNPTLQALNDANIAVYTLDVVAPTTESSAQGGLRDLAAATGGRFFRDLWDFEKTLQEISDLTSGYYLLSYRSRHPAGDSGYQRVRVGTRSREFRIQARQGYLYGPVDGQ